VGGISRRHSNALVATLGGVLDNDLMTLPEVAEALRLNPSTVRRWVLEGKLPGQKLGGKRWLVYRQDVQALLAGHPRMGKPQRPQRRPGTPGGEPERQTTPEDWSHAPPEQAARGLAGSARVV